MLMGPCCGTGSDPKSLSVNIQMASDNLSYFLKAAGASAESHIISLHRITVFCIFCWLMNSSELKKCYISLKGIKMSFYSAPGCSGSRTPKPLLKKSKENRMRNNLCQARQAIKAGTAQLTGSSSSSPKQSRPAVFLTISSSLSSPLHTCPRRLAHQKLHKT